MQLSGGQLQPTSSKTGGLNTLESPISRTITDTVVDTIVLVTVSAFLCPFYEYWGEFRTLQHCFVERLHDVVVLRGMGVVDQLHIEVSIR